MRRCKCLIIFIFIGIISFLFGISAKPVNADISSSAGFFRMAEPSGISLGDGVITRVTIPNIKSSKKIFQMSRLENRLRNRENKGAYKTIPSDSKKPIKVEDMSQEERYDPIDRIPIYRINIGDVINISVWRNPDLQKDVIVRPDGLLSFPLVGDVRAAGLTLTELDNILTKKLSAYVRNPVVSVAVARFGGTKVVVLGQVRGPGVYSPTGKGSVLEVIALAGGFTDDAVSKGVILVRGGLSNPQPIRLNLKDALAKADLSQNLQLRPNDIIYVPKKWIANMNYWVKQMTPTLSNILLGTSITRDIQEIHNRGWDRF